MGDETALEELTETTVFRAFERGEFLDWPTWRRLRSSHELANEIERRYSARQGTWLSDPLFFFLGRAFYGGLTFLLLWSLTSYSTTKAVAFGVAVAASFAMVGRPSSVVRRIEGFESLAVDLTAHHL